MATISPSGIAPACLGDQLDLICTTTGNFLEWTIDLIGTSRSPMLAIQSFGENDQMTQIHINSISFVFRRISTEGSLPLSSSLTITPVINSLNGTQVNCEDKETRASSSTVVSITNGTFQVCAVYSRITLLWIPLGES